MRPTGARVPGTMEQVRAVAALRIGTLRGRARRRASAGLALVAALPVGAAVGGLTLPAAGAPTAALFLPTAWLFFLLAGTLAAISGAVRELVPQEQVVAYPLSARADHLGALVLAPLNLSWLVQSTGLLALTSWVMGPRPGVLIALALTLSWIGLCTVTAHAAGWGFTLLRTTSVGVWTIRAAGLAAVIWFGVLTATGGVTNLIEALPVTHYALSAVYAGRGDWVRLVEVCGQFALAGAITWWLGARLAAAVHRRPQRVQSRAETRRYRRRGAPASELLACLRIDHASVWRSAPLRRGLLALAAIPGVASAASGLDWPMAALLPGLVASGAALLFGVNAFALDGGGALWRETLPTATWRLFAARVLVVGEVVFASALLAVAAASVRAPGVPTRVELLAMAGAVLATSAQVAARCMAWSIAHPYAASLRQERDQPAPPAAMAGYSARLALGTTATGLIFSFVARGPSSVAPVMITMVIVTVAAGRIILAERRWAQFGRRAHVVATVAAVHR